jgi:SAM-dependent methyltransferase
MAGANDPAHSAPSVTSDLGPVIGKVDVPASLTTPADHAAFFESIYARAAGDAQRVPWADLRPCPMMVEWLNRSACGLVRPGARALVVGSGLGDDVLELCRRGYDAMGIDISPTAVRWSQRRLPEIADRMMVADVLTAPTRWRRRFDLVVEIYTLQSLGAACRALAAKALAEVLSPSGVLLIICRRREDDEPPPESGPPWPLTAQELAELTDSAGLVPVCPAEAFCDQEDPPQPRLRGVFARP